MKKLTVLLSMSFALVFAFCFSALAQVASEPASVDQAVGFIPQIIQAFSSGKALLGCSLLVLVLVFAFKQYALPRLNLSSNILPWVSVGLGVLSALAVGITGGATPEAAALALFSGPAASSLWDTIVKHFAPASPNPAKPAA